MDPFGGPFILYCDRSRTLEEGSHNLAHARSAKRQILRLTRAKRVQARSARDQPEQSSGDWALANPFPARKRKIRLKAWLFVLLVVKVCR